MIGRKAILHLNVVHGVRALRIRPTLETSGNVTAGTWQSCSYAERGRTDLQELSGKGLQEWILLTTP